MAKSSGFNRNSALNIVLVALGVSLVCSIMVSVSAVVLKSRQDANVLLDQRRNILIAAGALEEGETYNASGQGIHEIFEAEFEQRLVNLTTGEFVADTEDLANYNQLKAAKDPDLSIPLSASQDIATLLRRENLARLYLKKDADGNLDKVVLPVRGYGLWGTLYGYLALQADYRTVAGLGFYAHKETPGLGGKVDDPAWKAQWAGKLIYDDTGAPAIRLMKNASRNDYTVDALAGATLTTRGVENLVKFWTGKLGFGPFLHRNQQRRMNEMNEET